jgi:hypothetical protein
MRGLLRSWVLLPTLLLVPALAAQVNPRATPAAPMLTEAQVRAKLLANPYIEGRIVALNLQQKSVTVEYVHINKKPQLDPITAKIAAKKVEFLKNAYDKAVESKFQPLIDKLGEELNKAQKEASGEEEVPVAFSLTFDAETKLRTMNKPLDENGKPKKFTAEEEKKLKGDPRLPGYTAGEEDLQMDLPVRFYIDKIKYRPTPAKSAKDKTADEKPTYPASMLVILPLPMASANENPFTKNLKK